MAIVRLEQSDLNTAAEALSRAFLQDPLQRYVLPDESERLRLSPHHFRPVLNYGLKFGEVFTTSGVPQGAAVWLPPGETNVTEERASEAGLDRISNDLGEQAAGRFFSVLEFLDPFHVADAKDPHWYVMVVGVDPSSQGQGLGRAILQPILDRADAGRHSCYLETAQPDNVGFYQYLGFRVVREIVEPTSGLSLWTFKREAA